MFSLSVNDWLVSRTHKDQNHITDLQQQGMLAAAIASDKTRPPIERLDAAGVAMKTSSAIMIERLWSYARILNDAISLLAVSEDGAAPELGFNLLYNIVTMPLSEEGSPNWAPLNGAFCLVNEDRRISLHKACVQLFNELAPDGRNGGAPDASVIANRVDGVVAALKLACAPSKN